MTSRVIPPRIAGVRMPAGLSARRRSCQWLALAAGGGYSEDSRLSLECVAQDLHRGDADLGGDVAVDVAGYAHR